MKKFLDYNDVLIIPKISDKPLARKDININIDTGYVPIVISNMLSTGTYKIADLMSKEQVLTFLHKEYSAEEHIQNLKKIKFPEFVGITSGIQSWDIEKTIDVYSQIPVGFINVDIANVYANMEGMVKTIKTYRDAFPDAKIVAGNICSPEPVRDLISAGANIIKIGVGPGAACKTRSEVGVGVPQFSAVQNVVDCAKLFGAMTIADGGCVNSGDVCKAIGTGADIVMIAGMVSHSEECDNVIEIDGKKYINFYGLGSNAQYKKFTPQEVEYRPNEGRDLLIPVKGSIFEVINQIKGALRSVCTYVGTNDISKLKDHVEFVEVNNTINKSLEKYER